MPKKKDDTRFAVTKVEERRILDLHGILISPIRDVVEKRKAFGELVGQIDYYDSIYNKPLVSTLRARAVGLLSTIEPFELREELYKQYSVKLKIPQA